MSEGHDDTLKWVKSANGNVPEGALTGCHDFNGEKIYVARASHNDALIPGKLVPSHGCAYVTWGGKEIRKYDYEVLVGVAKAWIATSSNNTPPGTFPGGHTDTGEKLFVGRVNHEGSLTPGKIQESHRLLYIPYGGKEVQYYEYEALTY